MSGKRRQNTFQSSLTDTEWSRYLEILEVAKSRWTDNSIRFNKTIVGRILLGLDPPNEIVTQEDVEYFRGNKF